MSLNKIFSNCPQLSNEQGPPLEPAQRLWKPNGIAKPPHSKVERDNSVEVEDGEEEEEERKRRRIFWTAIAAQFMVRLDAIYNSVAAVR